MIAFKDVDYTLYFDEVDLSHLNDDWEIAFNQLQNYVVREHSKFSLKTKDQLQLLCADRPGMLVFQNEAQLAVVHLSEKEPTEHIFYFNKDWFNQTIKTIKNRDSGSTIRWNGSGDKITILAGNGGEAKKFKMMFGPVE